MTTEPIEKDQGVAQNTTAPPQKTIMDLSTALSLYALTDSELFWELQLDTRCLIGWSSSKIVVSFRGTASMKNAVADMQVSSSKLLRLQRQVSGNLWSHLVLSLPSHMAASATASSHILCNTASLSNGIHVVFAPEKMQSLLHAMHLQTVSSWCWDMGHR